MNFSKLAWLLVLLGLGQCLASADDAPARPTRAASSACSYHFEAGLDGEIFPAFANYASLQRQNERRFGVLAVRISNPTGDTVRQRVMVQLPGWSDREIQLAEVAPGATRTLVFAPSFLPRFYQNREIIAATVQVSVTDFEGRDVYQATVPVRLRSAEDMYWGPGFKYAPYIASWVTPHDSQVEAVLARAKRYIPDRRLPGYEDWKDAHEQELETYSEARAIFMALHSSGLSYVKSSSTLGDHQGLSERVRLPHSSLSRTSANCIDAAVAYASLFENLGMDAEVVLVPGHAYVGVRVAMGSQKFLFLDAALTGRATFAAAVVAAEHGLARYQRASITPILIADARSQGIYPMPAEFRQPAPHDRHPYRPVAVR